MLKKTLAATTVGLLVAVMLAPSVQASEYAAVTPGYRMQFPRDHGAHPLFRTEWWYITGQARDESGKSFGFQITFFRTRTGIGENSKSRFAPTQLIMAHAAISDPLHGKLRHDQRLARGGLDLAYATPDRTHVQLGNWSLKQTPQGFAASIPASEFNLNLTFTPTLAPLLQGQDGQGFSQKDPDHKHASYYYSLPQLLISGSVTSDEKTRKVTGRAWMDHEWSSEYLAPAAQGWDWLGVNLDDGGALMVFRMRAKNGKPLWSAGTWLKHDGSTVRFSSKDIDFTPLSHWRSPRSNASYPVAFDVRTGNTSWRIEALMPDQELDARASTGTVYWEGAISASSNGKRVGAGYLELTGYDKPMRF